MWPSRRALVVVWLVAAVSFAGLLGLARAAEGPLDDPDPARQRPGFLDLGALPQPAPPVGPIPLAGRPGVVFFERPDRLGPLCRALDEGPLSDKAEVVVVVVVVGPAGSCPAVSVVVDPEASMARAYGLRRPRGGGTAVGYAVVDSSGYMRYRTLDPSAADELAEVATLVDALP